MSWRGARPFVTGLVVGGVHPKSAQLLARHSRIELTMQVYTDPRLLDLHGDIARLPEHLVTLPTSLPGSCQGIAENRIPSHTPDGARRPGGHAQDADESALEAVTCGREDGGSDGDRTRDLRLDRP